MREEKDILIGWHEASEKYFRLIEVYKAALHAVQQASKNAK